MVTLSLGFGLRTNSNWEEECQVANGVATVVPEPADKEEMVRKTMYNPVYDESAPPVYKWP